MLKRLSVISLIRNFLCWSLLTAFIIPNLSLAQLATPNTEGVSMGHLHFQASDIEASNEFWEAFGAKLQRPERAA